MTDKNPYENGVDIPDFVEKKDDDIDMSYFKMTEDEINKSSFDDDDDYDDDEEPRRKLSSKGIVVIGGIVIVLLLVAAISGWIFGISQKNAYTKLQTEYTALEENYNAQGTTLTQLQAQVNQLTEELKAKEEVTTTTEGETKTEGVKYKFAGDVGVRKQAGSKDGYATFNKLSAAVQDAVYVDGDKVTTRENAIIEVIATKEVDGATWGQVDDNAWICIKPASGEAFATKQ